MCRTLFLRPEGLSVLSSPPMCIHTAITRSNQIPAFYQFKEFSRWVHLHRSTMSHTPVGTTIITHTLPDTWNDWSQRPFLLFIQFIAAMLVFIRTTIRDVARQARVCSKGCISYLSRSGRVMNEGTGPDKDGLRKIYFRPVTSLISISYINLYKTGGTYIIRWSAVADESASLCRSVGFEIDLSKHRYVLNKK